MAGGWACSFVFLWAVGATAHHPAPSGYRRPLLAHTQFGVTTAGTEVNYFGHRAFATTHTLWAEVALGRWLALEAQLPYARLSQDEGVKTRGFGDVEIGGRVPLVQDFADRWDLAMGLAFELPSGRAEHGLGDGHAMASPSIATQLRFEQGLSLGLDLVCHFALGGNGHHEETTGQTAVPLAQPMHGSGGPSHPASTEDDASEARAAGYQGSLIFPHSAYEVRVRAPVTYGRGGIYGQLAPQAIYILGDASRLGPVSVEMTLGVMAGEHFTVSTGLMLPVAGEKRYDWRHSVMLGYQF